MMRMMMQMMLMMMMAIRRISGKSLSGKQDKIVQIAGIRWNYAWTVGNLIGNECSHVVSSV